METRKHVPEPNAEPRLDINERAVEKYTLLFTRDELDALDDLKIALRRGIGIPATKYDLVRCAVHELVEDFRTRGQHSAVVRRMRAKKPAPR